MDDQKDLGPLCPTHYLVMAVSASALNYATLPATWDAVDTHDYECSVDGCAQHYSPRFGYFALEPNDEHRKATGSPTLRISRNPTQVICWKHKHSMFLESFQAETKLQSFRCPQRDCQQTMQIPAGAAPAYWLGEEYFRTA
jgi:hypothetical protein